MSFACGKVSNLDHLIAMAVTLGETLALEGLDIE